MIFFIFAYIAEQNAGICSPNMILGDNFNAKIIGLLCGILMVSMVLVACRASMPENDNMARVEQILEQLREVDSSAALYSTSSHYQIVYSNDSGDEINYYNIKTKYYGEIKEVEGVHIDAIRSVIDPIITESSQSLKINDKDGLKPTARRSNLMYAIPVHF